MKCGPVAPRALPRFTATMGRSDSRLAPQGGLCIPYPRCPGLEGPRAWCVTALPLTSVSPHAATPDHSAPPMAAHAQPWTRHRVSQVPDPSFRARRPVSPRMARQVYSLVAPLPMSDFAHFGRLIAITGVTRPKGSLSLRLTRSSSGILQTPLHRSSRGRHRPAFRRRLPDDGGPRLHAERAIGMAFTFQKARLARLRLAHRRARRLLHARTPSCSSCPSW